MIILIFWLVVGIIGASVFVLFRRKLALRHLNKRDNYLLKKDKFLVKVLMAIVITQVLIVLFFILLSDIPSIKVILFESYLSILIGQAFLFTRVIVYVKKCIKMAETPSSK